ncbi:MAG: hypothetical protein U1E42_08890 [Rhodospirillales bacterium]
MSAVPSVAPAHDAEVVAGILARGTITADDVLALRRQVFADGIVARHEAESVFALNDGTGGNAAAWYAFFVEALTDYFVWQSDPRGYVDEAGATFLLNAVAHDGRIDSASELELVVNVIHWAVSVPESLRLMALSAVKSAVLTCGGPLFGPGRRRAGVLDRADVTVVSKLIYAAGGEGSLRITRREADLLFDLNDATTAAANDPGWRDLFVRAVASHLMFPEGEPEMPDADTVRCRERWLAERRGVGSILGGMLSGVRRSGIAGVFREADVFGRRRSEREREMAAADRCEGERRQAIDKGEAEWLLTRLHGDGRVDPNETALLSFIKANATRIDPVLTPLLAVIDA